MNIPQLNIEAARWNKIGRRWMTILVALLTINLSLVAWAVCGYAARPQNASVADFTTDNRAAAGIPAVADAGAIEDTPIAVSAEPVQASRVAEAEVESASAATADGVQPFVLPSDDSLVDLQLKPDVGPIAAPEAASQPATVAADSAAPAPIPALGADAGRLPMPAIQQPAIVIVNPLTTGGEVHYLVDGAACCLQPGEFQLLAGDSPRQLLFHPGDDLADVECTVASGVFLFDVSGAGWQLDRSTSADPQKLLDGCRQIEVK